MGMSDRWYKNAVIYGVDVETFMDADGNGVGDFQGLIGRLDYLRRLGVTCLWLLPFYPSPNRDNGYDIADYYSVDSRHGTLADFVEFLREAHSRGIRVLIDLVVNHTSDQHPWFQKARRDPSSPEHDFYIWTEDPKPPPPGKGNIFPGQEQGVWTYDEEAKAYYYHRFYHFEPGLKLSNPEVRYEIRRILGLWLQLGVDGFRVDAASHMIETKGLEGTEPDDPHEVLKELRDFVTLRNGTAVLLAEADESPSEVEKFWGEGDEMNMLFNFLLDNYLFLALAREEAEPLVTGLRILPPVPEAGQWANFLRNLDELDLERLTETQRQEVFDAFAPEEEMRIFGRGIRRRLAPMLGGDGARLRMAYSLLFSLPGTPVLVYGDEIGMGDDLELEGRDAVRTPMQWSAEENAGFSIASPEDLVRPVITEGDFSYDKVNVSDQRRDTDSLLSWMQRLIETRLDSPEVGWGQWKILEAKEKCVFAIRYDWEDSTVVAVHNVRDEPCTVTLEFPHDDGFTLVDVFGDTLYEPVQGDAPEISLEGYGYRWFRMNRVRKGPHHRSTQHQRTQKET